jgi:hypothetical protein
MRIRTIHASFVAALLSLSCAAIQRDARLRSELDAHRFQAPLPEVWPTALRLLQERNYPVVGRDRVTLGLRGSNALAQFFAKGHETYATSDGRWVAETDAGPSQLRYRVEGRDTGNGTCRIVFTVLHLDPSGATTEESRDQEMELDLVWRVEPARAEAMVQAAGGR